MPNDVQVWCKAPQDHLQTVHGRFGLTNSEYSGKMAIVLHSDIYICGIRSIENMKQMLQCFLSLGSIHTYQVTSLAGLLVDDCMEFSLNSQARIYNI